MRDTLAALIERVETATAEQQDEVMRDVVAHVTRRWDAARRAWIARALDAECCESAALALVPEGWAWTLYGPEDGRPRSTAYCVPNMKRHPWPDFWPEAQAATPALALCAAALRARMESER